MKNQWAIFLSQKVKKINKKLKLKGEKIKKRYQLIGK